MKTLQINSPLKREILFFLSLMISSLFFLASCQKEEQSLPSSENNSNGDRQVQNGAKPSLPDVKNGIGGVVALTDRAISHRVIFEMIKINHIAGRSMNPDYSVTVFSDGKVEYDGRRNVAVKDKVIMQIKDVTVKELRNLFEASKFFSLDDRLSIVADIPQVLTTFNDSDIAEKAPKTLIDYNHGYPAELIALRIRTESILNIAPLVTGHIPTAVSGIAIQ
ncbi:MAG: DUF6438 domain-containing protein [Bacteroidota bacterium]